MSGRRASIREKIFQSFPRLSAGNRGASSSQAICVRRHTRTHAGAREWAGISSAHFRDAVVAVASEVIRGGSRLRPPVA
jgi:hypothetical protein